MKVAVMQPYIFPYIGYFQLIHAADKFVFYDDVSYIKQGWINRNQLLVNGKASFFTIPVRQASSNLLIHETEFTLPEVKKKKLLRTIEQNYSNAPYYTSVFSLVSEVFNSGVTTISELAVESVIRVCEYIGLKREFAVSSVSYNNRALDRASRLIDICHQEGASHYVNAAGGAELYSKENFKEKGVELSFLESRARAYSQFSSPFVPYLSIIDVLMFNSPDDTLNMIKHDYEEV